MRGVSERLAFLVYDGSVDSGARTAGVAGRAAGDEPGREETAAILQAGKFFA